MTQAELSIGLNAAHAYLAQLLGWKEVFVKSYEAGGVSTIVNAADSAEGDVPMREHVAGVAIYKTIVSAGYGSQVTTSQCAVLAHVVYQAILKSRASAAGAGGTKNA